MMNWKNKLLDILPDSAKRPFHVLVDYWHSITNNELKLLKRTCGQKRFVLMCIPEHGNMGDQAIIIAEKKFLCDHFDIPILEISSNCFRGNKHRIKNSISSEDVIIITGGGSIGSLWKNEHDHIQEVIQTFCNNPIIIFPQTIYFDKSSERELSLFKTVIHDHGNLLLCVREKKSYSFALENELIEPQRLLLVPDIVLYLDESIPNRPNNGYYLLIERSDHEKINDISAILNSIKLDGEVVTGNTVIRHLRVTKDNREIVFENLIQMFRGAKVVITDRLHGMILSIITGTPCIAFDNSSHKVSGVFELINYLPNLFFCESLTDIQNALNEIEGHDIEYRYNKDLVIDKYNILANEIAVASNIRQKEIDN